MARLVTGAATLIIQPIVKNHKKSNWIQTLVGLQYHILDQNLYLELPQNEILLRIDGFNRLVQGSKKYIRSLSVDGKIMKDYLKSFYFTPLEPSFSLELNSGSFYDESRLDGRMWVDFRLSLRSFNIEETNADHIGCVVRVKISDYLRFLDDLEREVQQVMAM